jgi:hypothetical protein
MRTAKIKVCNNSRTTPAVSKSVSRTSGETRAPQQQQSNPQQSQPGQQNQQADRDRRQAEGIEGTGQDDLNNGSVGGVHTGGDLLPGRTGDGGAER